VVPLVPAFIFLCLEGLRRLLPERFHSRALGTAALLALATNAPGLLQTVRTSLHQPLVVPHAAYDWLKAHAGSEDRVVSMDMMRIHYFTGLKGSLFLQSDDIDSFVRSARAAGTRWVVIRDPGFIPPAKGVTDPTRWFYDRLVEYSASREFFEPVHRDDAEGVSIYALRPTVSGRPR
jgi:hypothetical protein